MNAYRIALPATLSRMQTPADRLKQARQAAGFINAVDAARRFGWNSQTYYGHENGTRGLTAEMARTYAEKFDVRIDWLLWGRGGGATPSARGFAECEVLPWQPQPQPPTREGNAAPFDPATLAPATRNPAAYVVSHGGAAPFGIVAGSLIVIELAPVERRDGDLVVARRTDAALSGPLPLPPAETLPSTLR